MQINGFNVMKKVLNEVSYSKEARQGYADIALEKSCAKLKTGEGKALDLFLEDAIKNIKAEPSGMDSLFYKPEMLPIVSNRGGLLDKKI